MKTTSFLSAQPAAEPMPAAAESSSALSCSQHSPQTQPPAQTTDSREYVRHIVFGSPENVRRVIHQLHALSYADATLWSPPVRPDSPLLISPKPDEVMRLLRKQM